MKTVCVQGLGFVGSAMSVAVASAKDSNMNLLYDVIGVDLPNKQGNRRVQSFNSGIFPFDSDDTALTSSFTNAIDKGNLKATTNEDIFSEADIIIVDINLDISYKDQEPQLELDSLKRAIATIGSKIKPGALLLIETTVPPGTCENVIVPIISSELSNRGIDKATVNIAHSYERVMPGNNYLNSIIEYPRVFSGHTKLASEKCREFLESVINTKKYPLTELQSMTASETAKVLENTYRAANIAFIDEWTKYAEAVGIDLVEIIEAIRVRESHSNIMMPGLGVGGYCLTKDPTFTPAAAKQIFDLDLNFPFSKLAVDINNRMPKNTFQRLKHNLKQENLEGKSVLIFGVTYREDVADTRYSASEILAKYILEDGGEVFFHDPYISFWDEMQMSVMSEYPSLNDYDAVILAVSHSEYTNIDLEYWNQARLLVDSNLVLKPEQIEKLSSMKNKLISIGRG